MGAFSVVVTPTVSLTPYDNGDQVGGVNVINHFEFTQGVDLEAIFATDKSANTPSQIYALFFDSDPTANITSVDNATLAMTDAGAQQLIGFAIMDPWVASFTNFSMAQESPNQSLYGDSSHNIYVVFAYFGSSLQYATASDFQAKFIFSAL